MKNLHILTPYTIKPQNIIRFVNKNFNKENNDFFVMAEENYVLRNNPALYGYENVIFKPQMNKKLFSKFRVVFFYRLLSGADNIVWHSFSSLAGFQLLFVAYLFRKKITWVEYSVDIIKFDFDGLGLKNRLKSFLGKKIREECKYWATSVYNSKFNLERLYKVPKDVFFLPQPFNPNNVNYLKEKFQSKRSMVSRKNILVGTDGLRINNHFRIIDRIAKFKGRDFSCFLPMNFATKYEYGYSGENKYVTEVIEYGSRVLEVPVVLLKKSSVDVETYFKVLDSMDIAVFDFYKPVFLDMLFFLLYLEKKVFIPFDSAIHRELKARGVKVFDTNKINEMSYIEFIENVDLRCNKEKVKKIMDEKYLVSYWQRYFDLAEGKKAVYGKN